MKRRHFIEFAGSALAAIGFSQIGIQRQGLHYGRVLAQSTPRKLALLVGINEYPSPINPLRGCITDIHLQRELLVNRYGFNPEDILLLEDGKATRQGILTAFEEHLIKQAKPGDVVVFHYSGHGSQVSDEPDCDSLKTGASQLCVNSTLVTYDSFMGGGTREESVVNDITGHTLFLLMYALKTDNVSVILDSCHSGGGTRGNFLIRSVDRMGGGVNFKPSPAEIAYQQQWLSRLQLSKEDYLRLRQKGVAKGVVIAAAQREQYACDAPFSDFHAGAFSYTLTRYLWQQGNKEGMDQALVRINLSTKTQTATLNMSQDPLVEYQLGREDALKQSPFFLTEASNPAAEAIITQVAGKQVTCWLGGVDPQTLDTFDKDSLFSIVGQEGGEVQLTSRKGLIAQGEVLKGSVKPGTLLQEKARVIPSDFALGIALDPSLGNEIETAKNALKAVKRIKVFTAGSGGDYLLGRMTQDYYQSLARKKIENLPPVGSVGLFSPGIDDIVPNSFAQAGEPVTKAIERLPSTFTSLFAGRLVKLTINSTSSRLAVDAIVTPIKGARTGEIVTATGTSRGRTPNSLSPNTRGTETAITNEVKIGDVIEVKVTNGEKSPLYMILLGIDSRGLLSILFPSAGAAADAALIKPGETISVPREGDRFTFEMTGPPGIAQMLVVCSGQPLRNTLKQLETIANNRGMGRGNVVALEGEESTNVIEALLGDNDENTRGAFTAKPNSGSRLSGVEQLAVLPIAVKVV